MLRYVRNLPGRNAGGKVPRKAREGREGDLLLSEEKDESDSLVKMWIQNLICSKEDRR